MKNVFLTITARMTFQLRPQIHAFPVIVIRKLQMDHVAALEVNATVNLVSLVPNVRNVHRVTKEKTVPDVHVTKEELCTVVNVNLIVNVR